MERVHFISFHYILFLFHILFCSNPEKVHGDELRRVFSFAHETYLAINSTAIKAKYNKAQARASLNHILQVRLILFFDIAIFATVSIPVLFLSLVFSAETFLGKIAATVLFNSVIY